MNLFDRHRDSPRARLSLVALILLASAGCAHEPFSDAESASQADSHLGPSDTVHVILHAHFGANCSNGAGQSNPLVAALISYDQTVSGLEPKQTGPSVVTSNPSIYRRPDGRYAPNAPLPYYTTTASVNLLPHIMSGHKKVWQTEGGPHWPTLVVWLATDEAAYATAIDALSLQLRVDFTIVAGELASADETLESILSKKAAPTTLPLFWLSRTEQTDIIFSKNEDALELLKGISATQPSCKHAAFVWSPNGSPENTYSAPEESSAASCAALRSTDLSCQQYVSLELARIADEGYEHIRSSAITGRIFITYSFNNQCDDSTPEGDNADTYELVESAL